MFVTTRPLTETTPDGGVFTHAQGATVPKFASWDFAVQKALLRMDYVREVADIPAGAERERATPVPAPSESPRAQLVVTPAALGGRPSCPHCPGKAFANAQGLKLHMTRIHGGEQPAAL
jgi:hypothetical protein